MSELSELYQDLILDHSKHPRNVGRPPGPTSEASGYNPLCGDRVTVYVRIEEDTIREIGFEGSGCAISTASASMMTEALAGRKTSEAVELFEAFHDLLTSKKDEPERGDRLGKLRVFAGVKEFPIRVKCATLAWHTFKAALERRPEPVTTES
jgi:nitrogen fixation NifU-like protein